HDPLRPDAGTVSREVGARAQLSDGGAELRGGALRPRQEDRARPQAMMLATWRTTRRARHVKTGRMRPPLSSGSLSGQRSSRCDSGERTLSSLPFRPLQVPFSTPPAPHHIIRKARRRACALPVNSRIFACDIAASEVLANEDIGGY